MLCREAQQGVSVGEAVAVTVVGVSARPVPRVTPPTAAGGGEVGGSRQSRLEKIAEMQVRGAAPRPAQ